MTFPPGFIWGAATASFQIEGAVDEDGRGESVWDRFAATPGRVRNGDSGAIACDFYHRYPEDVQLMKSLGLDAFRFSIAWPRVIPTGRGAVNEKGLDFYDRLVDELLANGITPFPTLFHWDLPQALEDGGGWTSRATVEAFCAYVQAVAGRLGDRVGHWATLNEPWVHAWLGYGTDSSPDADLLPGDAHAPGRASRKDALAACHHLLLAHGRALEILRSEAPDAQLGIVLNLAPADPESDSAADRLAASQSDGSLNRWFLDAIFRGAYPTDMLELYGADMPAVESGDLATISTPIDWLGVNHYFRTVVRASSNGSPMRNVYVQGARYTGMGFPWEVNADAMERLLLRLHEEYAPPCIYITENGAAFDDYRHHDGSVRDPERVDFLRAYIEAVGRATEAGVPVAGYFVWSLLDNFEWAHGYGKRFGIVFVDYPTLERVPKSSALWYRDLIAAQRAAATNTVEAT